LPVFSSDAEVFVQERFTSEIAATRINTERSFKPFFTLSPFNKRICYEIMLLV
jgi:hypothetical protein